MEYKNSLEAKTFWQQKLYRINNLQIEMREIGHQWVKGIFMFWNKMKKPRRLEASIIMYSYHKHGAHDIFRAQIDQYHLVCSHLYVIATCKWRQGKKSFRI